MKKTSCQRLGLILAVVCLSLSSVAFAGERPAGKAGANASAGVPTAPVGVKESESASIDLAAENVMLGSCLLRLLKMTIMLGGMVPLHSHADRPAVMMANAGEAIENSSKCLAPVVHKAGDVPEKFLGTVHGWVIKGAPLVTLTSSDIVNDKNSTR